MSFHSPISFQSVGFSASNKTCFSGFSTILQYGQRIAVVGPNGCGKSSLIKVLLGLQEPSEGTLSIPKNVNFGYVEQILIPANVSGAQIFHKKLTEAFSLNPNVLCLDEPTNHLDEQNRKSLLRMLSNFQHTLLIASHDIDLISSIPNTIWFIEGEKIRIFNGRYGDYLRETSIKEAERQRCYENARREQKKLKSAVEFEKKRNAQAKKRNSQIDDRMARHTLKMWGQNTHGKNISNLLQRLQGTGKELKLNYAKEAPKLSFKIDSTTIYAGKTLIYITNGSYGYQNSLVEGIHFQLTSRDRVALHGPNASGKSTFFKALLNDTGVYKTGTWQVSRPIGYLDQHYSTLTHNNSAIEILQKAKPIWPNNEIRRYLSSFLFSKNEDVNKPVLYLSGGEKARLALAYALINHPYLLLLDEITNNLDLQTRNYVVKVLKDYPGALLVISHEESFLNETNIEQHIHIKDQQFSYS